jgi:hypothetical protein
VTDPSVEAQHQRVDERGDVDLAVSLHRAGLLGELAGARDADISTESSRNCALVSHDFLPDEPGYLGSKVMMGVCEKEI